MPYRFVHNTAALLARLQAEARMFFELFFESALVSPKSATQ
jgi:hypothetical protein